MDLRDYVKTANNLTYITAYIPPEIVKHILVLLEPSYFCRMFCSPLGCKTFVFKKHGPITEKIILRKLILKEVSLELVNGHVYQRHGKRGPWSKLKYASLFDKPVFPQNFTVR